MEILQVSTTDIGGGAEHVALGLHEAYVARGLDAWMAVGTKRGNDSRVLQIDEYARNRWARSVYSLCSQLSPDLRSGGAPILSRGIQALAEPRRAVERLRGRESLEHPATWQLLSMPPRRPDILHCHNLHGNYFDLRSLPSLSQQVPTLLTLHDAWAFSGQCAHSLECDRWKTGCGNCPNLGVPPRCKRDSTAQAWKRKQEIFRRSRLFIATPSKWLMSRMDQSILAQSAIGCRVIPNGVDTRVFKPADKRAARAAIGLPDEAMVLLFAANRPRANPWKDYRTLRSALSRVTVKAEGPKLLLVVLGEKGRSEEAGPATIEFVPFQKNAADVARYYEAADVYVHATRADTFPTTILEAMACGLPVVATGIGGIPEQVVDGKTGYLVPQGDADSLASRLQALLDDPGLRSSMSRASVRRATSCFSLGRSVDQYLELYEEMLSFRGE